jgi:hypothetical protein
VFALTLTVMVMLPALVLGRVYADNVSPSFTARVGVPDEDVTMADWTTPDPTTPITSV